MKFVKGDAIAGIIITLINIIGGLVIGMAMNGMPLMEAVQTYSILTIGNGLVSQIPALLISICAGMVVTRVASENKDSNLGKDVAAQILAKPKAIAVASAILFVMFLIPGLPKIPFLILAAATGSVSYGLFQGGGNQDANPAKRSQAAAAAASEERGTDRDGSAGAGREPGPHALRGRRHARRPAASCSLLVDVRNSLYYELGVIFPSIQVSGNSPEPPGTYRSGSMRCRSPTGQHPRRLACWSTSPRARSCVYGLKGEDTPNPATGKPAAWIPRDQAHRARDAGLQVWDTNEILILHLATFLRKNAREFLGVQEVQSMIDTLKQYYPALVDEVVPKPISLPQLTEVLQRLVDEEVSIRDLKTILQSLSESARNEQDPVSVAERVRAALKRKICYQLSEGKPVLYVYQLDPDVEEMFRNSIRQSGGGAYLAMDPATIQQVLDAAYAQIGNLPSHRAAPRDSHRRRYPALRKARAGL